MAPPRFSLGRVVATPGALKAFAPEVIKAFLDRHESGDWGEVEAEDAAENELSVKNGYRVLSIYAQGSRRCWVITEADRASTTVLLPEEY
jgi:hypothetical protein